MYILQPADIMHYVKVRCVVGCVARMGPVCIAFAIAPSSLFMLEKSLVCNRGLVWLHHLSPHKCYSHTTLAFNPGGLYSNTI